MQNCNLLEVLSNLRNRGFSYLFVLKNECISCKDYNISFDEMDILEVHSFEIESSDSYDTLYAVECIKYNIKGVVLNLSEAYANTFSNIITNKIINNKNFEYKNTALTKSIY